MPIVDGMELLGERPVWSMSGREMAAALDQVDAEQARLETYRLHLVAGLDNIGYADQLGADDTARLQEFCDLVDTDGPEPDEHNAYARESLNLSTAEHGVKFTGYLANENAELFRTLIHAGARPHKTVTGDLDPGRRDKRQADALTAALTI